ncbi:PaaI family thioesterase [Gordonia sp. DT30]|uniref:PaaI family thioesterase n=1 Tax=Gordonia sp. DT30 TaxID=3416546 RepID=UPI003CF98FE7
MPQSDIEGSIPFRWFEEAPADGYRNDPDVRHAYTSMIDAVRRFQDAVAGSVPPPGVSHQIEAALARMVDMIAPFAVGEDRQLFNRVLEVSGRAQSFTPEIVFDHSDTDEVQARVVFRRFHLGGGGAAHGGAVSLVFDSLLGGLANSGRSRSRTVHLEIDYRHITPVDTELTLFGRVVEEKGRKRYLTGSLMDGDTILAEANGLFLALLPGQQ